MSEPFDVERIRPHARTGDDANIGIKAHLLRAAAAEIDRLRELTAAQESAVVTEISRACNENAERAERAEQIAERLLSKLGASEAERLTLLDKAWEAVNAIGGADTADDYSRGINAAVDQALLEIEKLGGMQPDKRKITP